MAAAPKHPVKRNFASLNAQEALHDAIFIEERNAGIYREFAEMFAEFRDPESLEIAAAFWDMSNDERTHGTLLQKRLFRSLRDAPLRHHRGRHLGFHRSASS